MISSLPANAAHVIDSLLAEMNATRETNISAMDGSVLYRIGRYGSSVMVQITEAPDVVDIPPAAPAKPRPSLALAAAGIE